LLIMAEMIPAAAVHEASGRGVAMGKISAEQEASCAIDWGLRRENLSKESQAVCDGVLEECLDVQRRTQTAVAEVSMADAEAASRRVVQDARRELSEGRRVFLAASRWCTTACWQWTHLGCCQRVVERFQNAGWRLDRTSWVPRQGRALRAEGIFLFRRAQSANLNGEL
jgi:hypothetical protein